MQGDLAIPNGVLLDQKRLAIGALLEDIWPQSLPGPRPFSQCKPLTRLSSNTTFAQPLVPLLDSDSDGPNLELDIEGGSIIRGIRIDGNVEIHDADPNNG